MEQQKAYSQQRNHLDPGMKNIGHTKGHQGTRTTTASLQKHHHKNTTPPQKHHHNTTTTSILPQFSTVVRFSPVKNVHFTTVFHRSPVQSGEKRPFHFSFRTVLSFRHVRSDERVARVSRRICVLLQFCTSDTSEVAKGSIGEVRNLRFTTVLSVRHARSDERVDRLRQKFVFYHSFERPTRTKWREGCQIHRCDPCAQTEKEYILKLFQKILTSSISLQSFL